PPCIALFPYTTLFRSDQAHAKLLALLAVILVREVTAEPSAFITQIFLVKFAFAASLPSRAREDVNTTFLPSGDNKGRKLSALLADRKSTRLNSSHGSI